MVIDSLAIIQQHTRIPVTGSYPEGHCLIVELKTDATPSGGTVGITMPLAARICEQQIDLGQMEVWLIDATLLGSKTLEGRTCHAFVTPDRTFRYSQTVAE